MSDRGAKVPTPQPSQRTEGRLERAKSVVAGVAVAIALGSPIALLSLPALALIGAPIAFALLDASVFTLLRMRGPRLRLRIFARVVASASLLLGLRVALLLRAADQGGRIGAWALPSIAIVVAVGWLFAATFGSLPRRGAVATTAVESSPQRTADVPHAGRAHLTDGALVALADAITAGWAFAMAVVLESEPLLRVRPMATIALSGTFIARTLVVVSVARGAATRPTSERRAAVAFVGWLAVAALAAPLASTAVVWSGIGAACVLTVASVLAESRKRARSVVVALGRGTIGWVVAAALAALSVLAGAK